MGKNAIVGQSGGPTSVINAKITAQFIIVFYDENAL